MEVTNVSDKVTHAVIGRGQVEEFGISQDAELFHILSSALYSRKKEAAVREVLCNAWDSHVESGMTHIALKVTLDHDKLVIRDFGHGLAPDQIKPIYGTYGKSTKQHDGRVTGGFGLGSKAPFAYVDHFEVISCCDGLKTIYKMSQSNAEVGGKPSIATIVSVPTDESGLQVTMNLKSPEDRHEFETLVKRIAQMGDMNVLYNDKALPTIPFREAEHGFMFVKARHFTNDHYGRSKDSIFVRYGHVVYPLNVDDRFSNLYNEVEYFLKSVSGGVDRYGQPKSEQWVLVLQADPHSISVTPSREDLSMTDKTVKAVTEMLTKFLNHGRGRLESTVIDMFEDAVSKTWLAGTPALLFQGQEKTPLIDRVELKDRDYIFDFDGLSRYYMKQTYPSFDGFRRKDLKMRFNALIESGFGNRGLLQSFRTEMLEGKSTDKPSTWFQRRVVGLALRKADPKIISPDRLYVYTHVGRGRYRSSMEPGFVQVKEWIAPNIEQCIPFLRNIVILTFSRNPDNISRADHFPIIKNWLGSPLHSLCYAVQRKTEKAKAARQHFERLGFTVIDLTQRQAWEHETVTEPVERAAPKPRKKGIVQLSAGLTYVNEKNGTKRITGFNTAQLTTENASRIINPEFIVKISSQSNPDTMFPAHYNIGGGSTLAIVRKYGHLGGVVQNSSQEYKLLEQGAKEMKPWLVDKILEEYKTNPLIKQHYEYSVAHRLDIELHLEYDQKKIFSLMRKDTDFRKSYGFPDPLSTNESDVIEIFETFRLYERRDPKFSGLLEIDALIESWTIAPAVKDLVIKIRKSKILGLIEHYVLESIFKNRSSSFTEKEQRKAKAILLLALEG